MATPGSIERKKFRQQLTKRIKANSTGRVPIGLCKQLAFKRTQAAVKQFEATQQAAIEGNEKGQNAETSTIL